MATVFSPYVNPSHSNHLTIYSLKRERISPRRITKFLLFTICVCVCVGTGRGGRDFSFTLNMDSPEKRDVLASVLHLPPLSCYPPFWGFPLHLQRQLVSFVQKPLALQHPPAAPTAPSPRHQTSSCSSSVENGPQAGYPATWGPPCSSVTYCVTGKAARSIISPQAVFMTRLCYCPQIQPCFHPFFNCQISTTFVYSSLKHLTDSLPTQPTTAPPRSSNPTFLPRLIVYEDF